MRAVVMSAEITRQYKVRRDMLPLAVWVRKYLSLASSCANCHELKLESGRRLCTSLDFGFDFDLVLLPRSPASNAGEPFSYIGNDARLRAVYLVGDGDLARQCGDSGVKLIPPEMLALEQGLTVPEAMLHTVPDLSERYIVFPGEHPLPPAVSFLDYFSANGLPLLFRNDGVKMRPPRDAALSALLRKKLGAQGPYGNADYVPFDGPYGQSKRDSRDILAFLGENRDLAIADSMDYRFAALYWSYMRRRGVG